MGGPDVILWATTLKTLCFENENLEIENVEKYSKIDNSKFRENKQTIGQVARIIALDSNFVR